MKVFIYLLVPYLTLIGVSNIIKKISPDISDSSNTTSIYTFVSLSLICFSLYLVNILFNCSFIYTSIFWLAVGVIGLYVGLLVLLKQRYKKETIFIFLNPIIIIPLLFVLFNYDLIPGLIKRDWDAITMYSIRDHFAIWNHSAWKPDIQLPESGKIFLAYPPGQHIQSYFWHMLLPIYSEGIAVFSRIFSFFIFIGIIFEFTVFIVKKYLHSIKHWEAIMLGFFISFLMLKILPIHYYAEMMTDRNNAITIGSAILVSFYFCLHSSWNWRKTILAGIIFSWASLQRPGFVVIIEYIIITVAMLVFFFSMEYDRYKKFSQLIIIYLIVAAQNYLWGLHIEKMGGKNISVNIIMIYQSIELFFRSYYLLFYKFIKLSKMQFMGHSLFLLALILYLFSFIKKKVDNASRFSLFFTIIILFSIGVYLSVVQIGEGAKLHPPFSAGRYLHPIGFVLFSFSCSLLPFLVLLILQDLLLINKWGRNSLNVVMTTGLLALFISYIIYSYNFSNSYVPYINSYLNIIQSHTKIDVVRLNVNSRIIYKNIGIKERRFSYSSVEDKKHILIIINAYKPYRLFGQYVETIFDGNDVLDIKEMKQVKDPNVYDAIYFYDFDSNSIPPIFKNIFPAIEQDCIIYKTDDKWTFVKGYSIEKYKYDSETYKTLYSIL